MTLAPMPVIVGVSRSGTTLLRLMLDAHPELAIPAETHWAAAFAPLVGQSLTPDRAVQLITSASRWPDLGLPVSDLAEELRRAPRLDITETLRCFYRLYARRHGKRRYGEKTPGYGQIMGTVQALLPEARFVHIIRDGRDVAVSWRGTSFAPGRYMGTMATSWKHRILTTRKHARSCRHYLEVRYEGLVEQPRETLETICRFIDLPFDEAMLDYHRGSRERLGELRDRFGPDGAVEDTRDRRLAIHRLATEPPRVDRIGRWRTELSRREVEEFSAIAGDLLAELGYESDTTGAEGCDLPGVPGKSAVNEEPRPRRGRSALGTGVTDRGGWNG